MSLSFTTVDGFVGKRLDRIFKVKSSFLKVQPGECLLPPQYVFIASRVRDLEIREDDVWIVSYPRTGSHWVQEMVWCIGNDCNFKAAETLIVLRNPLLESSALLVTGDYVDWFSKLGNSVEYVEGMKGPRYIKTHLPWELLPTQIHEKKPKIIYVTRNPKDTCVSFYHYCRTFHGIECSFEEFADLFLEDSAPMGAFWNHILKFWEHRNDENILFLTYEDMKRNQTEVIKKTAKFLNKKITEEQIEQLKDHLKFSKMKSNPAVNLEEILPLKNGNKDDPNIRFLRKGQIGDWKNYMSKDLERRFNEWTERNFKGTGFKFNADVPNGVIDDI